MTLDEKIESVRLDFIKFWKGEEWLNALQAYRTFHELNQMKRQVEYEKSYTENTEGMRPALFFPELRD